MYHVLYVDMSSVYLSSYLFVVFFFKQKTAYEMRISDWSSDVCSSDLMTDPNWEPVMKLASAIVTNRGGRTCHAAIIARELGIPAVVGCANATDVLSNGKEVTVSCAEGDEGRIYEGLIETEKIGRAHV